MSLSHLGPIIKHADFSDPKAYAEHLMTQSRSSFTLGMKMMSKERREAIFAVYAFCRVVDDIADEAGDLEEKRFLLSVWRAEIEEIANGNAQSLIGRALVEPVERFQIPKQELVRMIEGMETDVEGPVQAPSMSELLAYTRRVAGTVGMMSIRIFGVDDVPSRDLFALNLADALQLTNILRDVEEDAAIDRLYLPSDLLTKHGIMSTSPTEVASHENLRDVCRELGQVARARFNEARRLLKELKGQPLRPALMMMGVYETYLDRMEAADFKRDPSVHKMSKWQKLGCSIRYAFLFPNRPIVAANVSTPPLATLEKT